MNKYTWIGIIFAGIGIVGIRLLEIGNPTAQWFPYLKQFPPHYPLFKQIWELFLDSNLLYNIKQLIILEPGIFLFSIVSLIFSHPWKKPFTAIFIYTLFVTVAIGTSFKQPRYLLPALIPLSIFAAIGFLEVFKRLKMMWLKIGFIAVSLFMIFFNITMWNILWLRTSTATQAQNWIEKNISPDDTILSTAGKWISYTPSYEVLALQQNKNPHFFEQAYKILPAKIYPPNVRNLIYLEQLTDLANHETTSDFIETTPIPHRYLLDIYFDPHDASLRSIDAKKYHKITSFSPLNDQRQPERISNALATVDHPILPILLLKLARFGPYVDIYILNE